MRRRYDLKLLKKKFGKGVKYKIMYKNRVISTHDSARVANKKFDQIQSAGKKFKKLIKGKP